MTHFFKILRSILLNLIVELILLSLKLLPDTHLICLLLIKWEHLLGLLIILTHLETILHLIIVAMLCTISFIVITHVVVSLTKSIRSGVLHLLLPTLNSSLSMTWLTLSSCIYIGHHVACSFWSLRSVSWMTQALSLFNLLVNMCEWILQMRIMSLLLIKRCHTKLLMW